MNTLNFKYFIYSFSAAFLCLLAVSCSERDLDHLQSDTHAPYATTAEVCMDGFSGGEDFSAWGYTSNLNTDYATVYDGVSSMRIEVPGKDNASGTWSGGRIYTSAPRNLSGYDCLTFYAKSSTASYMTVGFGDNDDGSIYKVSVNIPLTSNWTKYYIPVPDASKLMSEKGMFFYSANTDSTDGKGYSIWFDDVKYEKLGTIKLSNPGTINSGADGTVSDLESGDYAISSCTGVFNLPTTAFQKVVYAAGYLTLTSSNLSVATVSKQGYYTVVGKGSTLITAALNGTSLTGSYLVNSIGLVVTPKTSATTPTLAASSVVSLFSDAYTNMTVDSWNPYYSGSTAVTSSRVINGTDNILRYSTLNWVCILFNSNYINASTAGLTYLHIDVWTPDTSTNQLILKLHDYATATEGSYTYPSTLTANQWTSIDVPISSFSGLSGTTELGMIILASSSGTLNIYMDNLYFHK
jgi:hypothetical protein